MQLPPYHEYFNSQILSRAKENNNDDDTKIISLSENNCTAFVRGSARYKVGSWTNIEGDVNFVRHLDEIIIYNKL